MGGISRNQKKIIELLKIKPDMTTKEIAELTLGKIVPYKSKDFASFHRSLISLERKGCIQRVHVKLKWRLVTEKKNEVSLFKE